MTKSGETAGEAHRQLGPKQTGTPSRPGSFLHKVAINSAMELISCSGTPISRLWAEAPGMPCTAPPARALCASLRLFAGVPRAQRAFGRASSAHSRAQPTPRFSYCQAAAGAAAAPAPAATMPPTAADWSKFIPGFQRWVDRWAALLFARLLLVLCTSSTPQPVLPRFGRAWKRALTLALATLTIPQVQRWRGTGPSVPAATGGGGHSGVPASRVSCWGPRWRLCRTARGLPCAVSGRAAMR